MKRVTYIFLLLTFLNYCFAFAYDIEEVSDSVSTHSQIITLKSKLPLLSHTHQVSYEKNHDELNRYHHEYKMYLPEFSEEITEEISKVLNLDLHFSEELFLLPSNIQFEIKSAQNNPLSNVLVSSYIILFENFRL